MGGGGGGQFNRSMRLTVPGVSDQKGKAKEQRGGQARPSSPLPHYTSALWTLRSNCFTVMSSLPSSTLLLPEDTDIFYLILIVIPGTREGCKLQNYAHFTDEETVQG